MPNVVNLAAHNAIPARAVIDISKVTLRGRVDEARRTIDAAFPLMLFRL
jgi:hypothetical protein